MAGQLFQRLALAFLLPSLTICQSNLTSESDDGRRWLDSRNRASSVFDAASRAAALNQNDVAEERLRKIIRKTPRSAEAGEAHKLLSRIYIRTGRYTHATDNLDRWLRDFPGSSDAKAEQRDVEQMRGLPDQINGRRRPSILKHEGDLWVPLSVNGKECTFLMDTGAWVSAISQQAAERLGVEFSGRSAAVGDSSGKSFLSKTAVAKELVLGNMRFHNVSFFVIPDQKPFTSMPVDRRGILGVPIHLAVGTWQWSKSGTIRLGEILPPQSPPNLVFFRNKIALLAEVARRNAFLTLDSGATTTDLNSGFLENFGDLVGNAQKTTRDITGLGGTSSFEAYGLTEVRLSVAGHQLALGPTEVTVQKLPGTGGECCVGNFGDDLLLQAEWFSLNFDNMALRFDKSSQQVPYGNRR